MFDEQASQTQMFGGRREVVPFTRLRILLLTSFSFGLACSKTSQSTPSAVVHDADTPTDVPPNPVTDRPSGGTDAPPDAVLRCSPSYPVAVSRVICDSQLAEPTCFEWARDGFPPNVPTLYQRLCAGGTSGSSGQSGRCVAADQCGSLADPASCRCGTGPACPADQSCIATSPSAVPTCRCRTQEPQRPE